MLCALRGSLKEEAAILYDDEMKLEEEEKEEEGKKRPLYFGRGDAMRRCRYAVMKFIARRY